MKTVLITGATGFVGSHLARWLSASGIDVHALMRPSSDPSEMANTERIICHPIGDRLDELLAVLKIVRPEVVLHLASLFIAEHKPADINALIHSNILFGTRLLEAMDSAGVKVLINAGTSWQHYSGDNYHPVNLYAATKQAFEDILAYYVEARGFKAITLKLFDTYGPRDHRKKILFLLNQIATSGTELAMSPGEQLIDLVHIDDICRAFMIAAQRGMVAVHSGHERFALSSGQPRSLREIVLEFERVRQQKLTIHWGARPYRAREVMIPWNTGVNLPGWTPQIPLSIGFRNL